MQETLRLMQEMLRLWISSNCTRNHRCVESESSISPFKNRFSSYLCSVSRNLTPQSTKGSHCGSQRLLALLFQAGGDAGCSDCISPQNQPAPKCREHRGDDTEPFSPWNLALLLPQIHKRTGNGWFGEPPVAKETFKLMKYLILPVLNVKFILNYILIKSILNNINI